MIIENGEQIIGYQYLHGTNSDAGGYLIRGTIDKSKRGIFIGKTIFRLTYQWNDIIDPNFQYSTDKAKSEFAKIIPFSNPKDYNIHISWFDVSVMNFSGKFLTGWLSNNSKENKFKFIPVIL